MFVTGNRLAAFGTFNLLALTLTGPAFAGEKPFPKAPAQQTQNMQACPEYGRGFFKIPGSDLCTRVGGSVRGETGFSTNSSRRSDAIDWRTQGTVDVETRDNATGVRAVMRVKGVTGR